MADKYRVLAEWLTAQPNEPVMITLAQLSALVGGLPPSALRDRTWWANTPNHSQGAAWLRAGWLVDRVDLNAGQVSFVRGAHQPRSNPGIRAVTSVGSPSPGGREPIFDGAAALDDLAVRAGWASVEALVAAHTVFLHPITVAQAGDGAVFPIVRDPMRRGQLGELPDGSPVLFDDNATPTDVFLWSANRVKGRDVQFNHVWSRPSDPESYTALWNLCCTPAFLAKTSDSHQGVMALLRYRAVDLYGRVPDGEPAPERPAGYEALAWAPMPAPVEDLEAVLRARMRSAPLRRASTVARTIGWAFSNGPDHTL